MNRLFVFLGLFLSPSIALPYQFSLNGNKNIDFGNSARLAPGAAFSWSGWVYMSSAPEANDGSIVSKAGTTNDRGWRLQINNTNPPTLLFGTSALGVTHIDALGTTAITTGVWTHVAAVYDGSVPSERIYVNGVLDVELTVAVPVSCFNSSVNHRLGTRGDNSFVTSFYGRIQEEYLWNVALTAAEVVRLSSPVKRVGLDIRPQSLSYYHPLDETQTSGTGVIKDYGPNNFKIHGTPTDVTPTNSALAYP